MVAGKVKQSYLALQIRGRLEKYKSLSVQRSNIYVFELLSAEELKIDYEILPSTSFAA